MPWKSLSCLALVMFALPALAQPETVCTPIPAAQNGTAYPVRPTDCGSYTGPFNNPAIFFAAHPDDETLGMAGSISQALATGRTVVVELMTRGTGSGAYNTICSDSTTSSTSHTIACGGSVVDVITHGARTSGPLLCDSSATGRSTFGDARVREFMDSMRRLGVQAIAIHDYPDGGLTASVVAERVRFWTGLGLTGLSVYGTAGNEDYRQHPDHAAVHDGITSTGVTPRTFLSVYAGAICDATARAADSRWRRIITLDATACSAKQNALSAYQVWNPSAGRYSVGWWHSTGDLFDSTSSDCKEYVTDDGTAPVATGNPFIHATVQDQYLACQGLAGRTSSSCTGISDVNDRQMCSALAARAQSPCGTISDRNLQLACYGMSVAPNYPSNCRNITDAQMRAFCYGVSSGGSMPDCASVTHADTRALCYGMALHNISYCASITHANDRQFCNGVASNNSTYCASIN